MIELIDINKTYPAKQGAVHALQEINLTVQSGEIFGVIGSSGAGKSTLIRCVNLLEVPDSGVVRVNNLNMLELSNQALREARHKIGMIFQGFNLLTSRTIYDNIALPLEFSNVSKEKIRQKVLPLLELTGLSDKKNNYPAQLSGGQKQRVAIARALATDPLVLLSDEATSALDPETTHSILELLKDINRQLGLTILLITHEMEVIKQVCKRLAVIEHGKIVEQSEVIHFFKHPQSKTGKAFLKNLPSHKLPEIIQQTLREAPFPNSFPLMKISFIGDAAKKPLIADLVREFSLKINILQANIEEIREEILGIMVLEVHGNLEQIGKAKTFLREHDVDVEVLGYVQ